MEPGTCEVWWASTAWSRPWHTDLLSDSERARRTGLWEAGRAQYTVAAALLRLAAASHTARAAEQVVVDRSCPRCGRYHGRPRLPGTGLYASISHSGTTVAVALSCAGQVGVDVQQVEDDPVGELLPLVLAEPEIGHVAAARDFFTYWVRKEALVKATGDGVTVPLPEVMVSPPGTPARLLGYPGRDGLAAQLNDLSPHADAAAGAGAGAGYVGALAVLSPLPVVVHERSGERLLTAQP
jgi:4'-phosphopantetheinyl transferase